MKLKTEFTLELTPKQIEDLMGWADELGYNTTKPIRWVLRQVFEEHGTYAVSRATEWAEQKLKEQQEREEREG